MNYNLNKVLDKIIEEEELAREFSQLDDMDEMYSYCRELGKGYTEEEFDEGIAEVIDFLKSEEIEAGLSDEGLRNIAGGMNFNGLISKTAAVMLSALTLGSATFSPNTKAAEPSANAEKTQSISENVKSDVSDKWSKTKGVLSNLWANHKKKIIAGATIATLAVAGTAAWVYKHKKDLAAEAASKKAEEEKSRLDEKLEEDQQIEKRLKALADRNDKTLKNAQAEQEELQKTVEKSKKKIKEYMDTWETAQASTLRFLKEFKGSGDIDAGDPNKERMDSLKEISPIVASSVNMYKVRLNDVLASKRKATDYLQELTAHMKEIMNAQEKILEHQKKVKESKGLSVDAALPQETVTDSTEEAMKELLQGAPQVPSTELPKKSQEEDQAIEQSVRVINEKTKKAEELQKKLNDNLLKLRSYMTEYTKAVENVSLVAKRELSVNKMLEEKSKEEEPEEELHGEAAQR